MIYKNLIFDGDNTLWECSKYYNLQKSEFAEKASKRTGYDVAFCSKLLNEIDVSFTTTPEAFGRDRYPRAFAATSAALDIMSGKEVDKTAAEEAFEIGDAVFLAKYELYDGVLNMLEAFYQEGRNLFLYSKGDLEVQQRKIEINGLKKYFPKFRTYIVLKKAPKELQKIMDNHSLVKNQTLVIGDSLRDEISCATKLGIGSLFVPTGDQWGYENVEVSPTYTMTLNTGSLVSFLKTIENNITKDSKCLEKHKNVKV